MAEIRDQYRTEFEEAGVDHVRRTLQASNYNGAKLIHARKWLDEKDHGEDRAYRAAQLKYQRRGDLKTTFALILSGIAIAVSIWAKFS